MGLYGFAIPEEYDGLGLNAYEEVQLVFELGYTTPAFQSLFGTNNGIAGHTILEGGTEEQERFCLPSSPPAKWVASFALSEPDAGSDPVSVRTRATRDGDHWVINGAKRYITLPWLTYSWCSPVRPRARRRARGVSAFIVPRDTPGLSIGPKDKQGPGRRVERGSISRTSECRTLPWWAGRKARAT